MALRHGQDAARAAEASTGPGGVLEAPNNSRSEEGEWGGECFQCEEHVWERLRGGVTSFKETCNDL